MAVDPLISRIQRMAGGWWQDHPRTILAVSGGADSVAMTHLLLRSGLVAPDRALVVHVDHGLRPDSAEDAGFVRELAADLGLAVQVVNWRTADSCGHATGNLADAARRFRYQVLGAAAATQGAQLVAVAHHRDDQAETVLERLLRGSGVTGLGAMRLRRRLADGVDLARPLLTSRRDELRGWLVSRGLSWREDPSNRLLCSQRNRIRLQLLPELARFAGGDPVDRLDAMAASMQQADSALEWMVQGIWVNLDYRQEAMGGVSLLLAALIVLPDELMGRVLIRIREQLVPGLGPPSGQARLGFCRMVRSTRRSWRMSLRGLAVGRDGERLWLKKTNKGSGGVTPPAG